MCVWRGRHNPGEDASPRVSCLTPASCFHPHAFPPPFPVRDARWACAVRVRGRGELADWRRVRAKKRLGSRMAATRPLRPISRHPRCLASAGRSHCGQPVPHTTTPHPNPQVNTPAEEPDCYFADDAVELQTPPHDPRFPATNQSRNCFTQYNMYHKCVAGADGDADADACEKYRKAYRSLCPGEWVAKWNEQRDAGSWPGKY